MRLPGNSRAAPVGHWREKSLGDGGEKLLRRWRVGGSFLWRLLEELCVIKRVHLVLSGTRLEARAGSVIPSVVPRQSKNQRKDQMR